MGCGGSKAAGVDEPLATYEAAAEDVKPVLEDSPETKTSARKKSMQAGKRRVGVSAEATKESEEEYVKTIIDKSPEIKARIVDATMTNALFAGLAMEQMIDVVDAMFEVPCTPGKDVITQGDVGDNFYVADSGEYEVYLKQTGEKPVHTYKAGGCFGDLALMYNCPRAATVRCSVAGSLWGLDRVTFRAIVMVANKKTMATTSQFLKSVSILSPLTDEQRETLSTALTETTYEDGDYVVSMGEPADALYLIKSGEVVVHKKAKGGSTGGDDDKELIRMKRGEFFGESALQSDSTVGQTRVANVVAVGKVTVLQLTRDSFTFLLGDLRELMKHNFNNKVLSGMDMFKQMSSTEKEKLIESLSEVKFPNGEEIMTQGQDGDFFYIIKTGSVKVTQQQEGSNRVETIKEKLQSGEYFGEVALLEAKPRMATVTATSDVVCMALDRSTFTSLLGPLGNILSREATQRKLEAEKAKRPVIAMRDLKLMTILGVGTFGRVKLVLHLPTNTPYALKCMRKGQIVALKQVEHVMNEKKILAMCDHPFLLTLAASYQDADELYMLMSLALGGELFSILRERNKFDEPTSRFYAANVCSAFEYLHEQKVVYRDLKPENLLLDDLGYLKVVDFGFAKIITDRTWTLCGTPEYLAPEIITNKGHNLGVDWWAIGILIFEMLVGFPPFCADDPMEIYQKILRGKITFPVASGKSAKDLVTKLLAANPTARLGCLKRGGRDVREHAFFKPVDFGELEAKKIKAPFIPTIKSPLDTSNFEHYDDDDEGDWARYNDKKSKVFDEF